jgi:hypothetical protein
MERMCGGKAQAGDPGLEVVVDKPLSAEELGVFFRMKRDEFETQQAAKIALERFQNIPSAQVPTRKPDHGGPSI